MQRIMGVYAKLTNEPTLGELSSRSFSGKAFEGDALSSENFEEAQQGIALTLNYSIEEGLEDHSLQKNKKSPGWFHCSRSSANPRKRKILVAVLIGVLLVLSICATALANFKGRPSSMSTADEIEDNEVSSRSQSRGEGGEVASFSFVQPQSKYIFANDDVVIPPFSTLDPVEDLDIYDYDRPLSSSPSARLDPLINRQNKRVIPTNAWYQNMLRLGADEEPTKHHRVYTVPYVLDAAGDFAGIRIHATRPEATATQVRMATDEPYALTLGAMTDISGDFPVSKLDKGYSVHEATNLGLTLHWDSYMKTTLVRGSPYVTMIYNMIDPAVTEGILPTMHWRLDTSELPIVDGNRTVDCESEPVFTVERDLELAFLNSGQRWLVFFSRPVQLKCKNTRGSPTIFQVLKGQDQSDDSKLVIRGALVVSNFSPADEVEVFSEMYANQLRASADVYPGQSTTVTHSFNEENSSAKITFHWDPHSMRTANGYIVDQKLMISGSTDKKMIMFALPHHQEILVGNILPTLCTFSLLGPVCLVEGNVWEMYEGLPAVDYQAARHPHPKYLPVLAQALVEDIRYQIPSNFLSGAGDTYFSGKTIAKLARILLIAEEVKDLCESASAGGSNSEHVEACDGLELPGDEDVEDALNQLREAVTVWVKTNSETPFVYDNAWGGLISCGCLYQGGKCTNQVPDCPAFTDQGLNFGNGFYNDHHFHYGYHIYAAAVLAHFDSSWAIDHYEDVTLLVRDYANPSEEDKSFPVFRNKDWYRGHSWASGLTEPMFGNIMNQESSSEAIMAYEAVALFGKTMTAIFQDAGDLDKASVAKMMHKIGLTLTATEIRSTQRYWQIQQNVDSSEKTFPELYTTSVVGILWETFAEFTTWFGNAPYLIYGIQLLPLTPISEARDKIQWAKEIYQPLTESCNGACVSEGWSIQVNAILATIGGVQEAIEGILRVPSTAYKHAGGNGHSKSNSLWYVSTRPTIDNPSFTSEEKFEVIFDQIGEEHEILDNYNDVNISEDIAVELSCFNPMKCSNEVLDSDAEGYSCRQRIIYLMNVLGKSELDGCRQVAVNEYPAECGLCGPSTL
uniref:glucan endo-1,3-beta-D-glucosidase n=1 Tax=Pseudo-nitzschia australis TaxID=44445 RepID=A0A7S4AS41_9STRA|mmetsp:Transcript_17694/g.38656  ORF Transcript_17694/g.38656 Transcript_17694/m.38656 type:complete len:1078 (+) Transcript_17694:475-3708(+)